jgi:hypothetical protein
MRKVAIVLAAVIAASLAASSADAQGRKKAAAAAKPDPAVQARQDTARLFHDLFHGQQPKAEKGAKGKKAKRG